MTQRVRLAPAPLYYIYIYYPHQHQHHYHHHLHQFSSSSLQYELTSQINYELLAQQQQKQLAVLQAQIQALLATQREGATSGVGEVARIQMFDRSSKKISGFVTAYKLYIRMKMRGVTVEKQIQWILSYVQERSVDV